MIQTGVREIIVALAAEANEQTWAGKDGATVKEVYLAMLRVAYTQTTLTDVSIANRTLAERVGASRSAVNRAISRLIDEQRIARRVDGAQGRAATYGLIYRITGASNEPTMRYSLTELFTPITENQLWGTLGRTAQKVYGCLTGDPKTITQLAQESNCTRETVSTALKTLEEAGLTESGWTKGDASIQQAAIDSGAIEQAEERKRQHQEERRSQYGQERMLALYEKFRMDECVLTRHEPEPITDEDVWRQLMELAVSIPCTHCNGDDWVALGNGDMGKQISWECTRCLGGRTLFEWGFIATYMPPIYCDDDGEYRVWLDGAMLDLAEWYRLSSVPLRRWAEDRHQQFMGAHCRIRDLNKRAMVFRRNHACHAM